MAKLREPCLWRGNEFVDDRSWLHKIEDSELEELSLALNIAKNSSLNCTEFKRADFKLFQLKTKLQKILNEVENGRGFAVLRGLPIKDFSRQQIETILWGLSTYMGYPISQNSQGQLITEVADKGSSYAKNINDRGYMSGDKLNPHVDTSDMSVLLCLETAASGGKSSLTSSLTIYNEILKSRPDLLDIYKKGFYHDLRGEGPTESINEVTSRPIPVFSFFQGFFSCCYNDKIIRSAHQKIGKQLTLRETQAVDLILQIAERKDIRFDFDLKPGDIQFINNYVILHFRSAFRPRSKAHANRCLLRMWINSNNPRPLAPNFADRYNTGPRGGVFVRKNLL